MPRLLLSFIFLTFTFTKTYAFRCYITLVKDSCWTNYNVSVDAINVMGEKLLTSLVIPQGTSWVRNEIDCQPKETLLFKATFTPAFWEKDAGKIYYGKRYWSFPETIGPNESAWNMTVCYGSDFAAIPLPPDAAGNCACDTSTIPVIKPT